jgi:hypothetical protein
LSFRGLLSLSKVLSSQILKFKLILKADLSRKLLSRDFSKYLRVILRLSIVLSMILKLSTILK